MTGPTKTPEDPIEQEVELGVDDGLAPEGQNLITGMGGGNDPISAGVSTESDRETISPTGRIAAPEEVPGSNPVFAGGDDPSGNDPLTDRGRDRGGDQPGADLESEAFAHDSID